MRKIFRCGRLMLTKDGEIKKIDLKHGGGTRSCDFFYNITFNDIHQRLINIYNLSNLIKNILIILHIFFSLLI